MREQFENQLKSLHNQLTEMGELCEKAISSAVRIFTENDKELVTQTLETDSLIDRKEREIENFCIRIILQQQPVARDLRDVSSALKMISDMERIGDQASDIAELGQYVIGHSNRHEETLLKMAAESIKMVTSSIQSFINRDLDLAKRVILYDDIVDGLFASVRSELCNDISSGCLDGEYYIDILMVAKYLERIADHATNIAEWVEYSITGIHTKDGKIFNT